LPFFTSTDFYSTTGFAARPVSQKTAPQAGFKTRKSFHPALEFLAQESTDLFNRE
jgi:hypothetical protein